MRALVLPASLLLASCITIQQGYGPVDPPVQYFDAAEVHVPHAHASPREAVVQALAGSGWFIDNEASSEHEVVTKASMSNEWRDAEGRYTRQVRYRLEISDTEIVAHTEASTCAGRCTPVTNLTDREGREFARFMRVVVKAVGADQKIVRELRARYRVAPGNDS